MWWTSQNNCVEKRAKLHFSEIKHWNEKRQDCMRGFALQICLLFPDWAKLDPSLCPQSDDCICQALTGGDALHTQTRMQTQSQAPLNCLVHTCYCKPQNLHTQTHTLKCSKEIRAAGQGGVRLASSANLLFLHLSRSPGIITHILDIALQFPPWREKRKVCLLLYAVGMSKWTPARSNCGTLWPEGEFCYRQTAV